MFLSQTAHTDMIEDNVLMKNYSLAQNKIDDAPLDCSISL